MLKSFFTAYIFWLVVVGKAQVEPITLTMALFLQLPQCYAASNNVISYTCLCQVKMSAVTKGLVNSGFTPPWIVVTIIKPKWCRRLYTHLFSVEFTSVWIFKIFFLEWRGHACLLVGGRGRCHQSRDIRGLVAAGKWCAGQHISDCLALKVSLPPHRRHWWSPDGWN